MRPLHLAKDGFALSVLVLQQTSDIPKNVICLARRYNAEGDEELAYLNYWHYVRLIHSIKKNGSENCEVYDAPWEEAKVRSRTLLRNVHYRYAQ